MGWIQYTNFTCTSSCESGKTRKTVWEAKSNFPYPYLHFCSCKTLAISFWVLQHIVRKALAVAQDLAQVELCCPFMFSTCTLLDPSD